VLGGALGEWFVTTDDKIWIGQNGQKYGPYTEAHIRQWMIEGKLASSAVAWRSGMPEWVPLSKLFPRPAASRSFASPTPSAPTTSRR
jgi:hypothetical protein